MAFTAGLPRRLAAVFGAVGAFLLPLPPAAAAPPRAVDTISLPGAQPLAVEVYERGNAVFVTDDQSGDLLKIDGATNAVVARVHVGSSALALGVHEASGRVFVASSAVCCTSGLKEGNGLISIVDADTATLIGQIDPVAGPPDDEGRRENAGEADDYELAIDQARGRVYVTFGCVTCDDTLGVIDAPTGAYMPIRGHSGVSGDSGIGVNSATNEIFIPGHGRKSVLVVDGATLATSVLDLRRTGGATPLDIAVNEAENKLYLTMLRVPRQGEIGILILDRDTGRHKFVGKDDLEPLAFNPRTNRLFSGVQVGARGAVIDGASDRFTYVRLGGGGIDGIDVRQSTDNAWMASQNETFVLNGRRRCAQRFRPGIRERGGIVTTDVSVNQQTGRVYVLNDDKARKLTVMQDGTAACPRR